MRPIACPTPIGNSTNTTSATMISMTTSLPVATPSNDTHAGTITMLASSRATTMPMAYAVSAPATAASLIPSGPAEANATRSRPVARPSSICSSWIIAHMANGTRAMSSTIVPATSRRRPRDSMMSAAWMDMPMPRPAVHSVNAMSGVTAASSSGCTKEVSGTGGLYWRLRRASTRGRESSRTDDGAALRATYGPARVTPQVGDLPDGPGHPRAHRPGAMTHSGTTVSIEGICP